MKALVTAVAFYAAQVDDSAQQRGGAEGRHARPLRREGVYAVGAAVEPTKIGLSTPRPTDFERFWEDKLAATGLRCRQRGD